MLSTILLGLGLVVGAGLGIGSRPRRRRPPRGRPTRSDTRPAAWFQLASYGGGLVTHLTPMRDGDHFEDEVGECGCNPVAGAYRLDNGRQGLMYVHRLHRAVAHDRSAR